ncbi:HNH endonuclease [Candidatus Thiomargarita nelsonii]|uniref:HNH endonuclease n=1 Tax=Candidatus Thiomargarita nelsonii TaxID=1003181 RepID=A0A0A6PHT5_9GAMM|nr:HNH endonuclease [Candidatus Thiomargarita nelsonii]
MLVFVLNQHSKPLMPCKPSKAKKLLKASKAKVVNRTPFTISLLFGSSGYKQPITAGMDTGSQKIGVAAIANGQVIYQSEIEIRQDISKKMQQRQMYRRTRRGRKTRYRPARWLNRASMRQNGRLAPSVQSKVHSHLREKRFVESLLPVTAWHVETAHFDIHKIVNPDVSGKAYQEGEQKGFYNVKAYVLHRDGYKCKSGQKGNHSKKLHVHHIQFKSNGGTDIPSNLITLCETCHDALHLGEFELKTRKTKTKHATEMGIIKSQLIKSDWDFAETFGYETKFKREQVLQLPKTHYNDAIAISCEEGELVKPLGQVLYKKHIAKGDYQQTTGKRSEKTIPTGKLFGLKKFDLVSTSFGIGFIKGKRSSGYFALMDIFNNTVTASVNVKKYCQRLTARTGTLIQEVAIPPLSPIGT